MPNGLVSTLAVVADFLPELTRDAAYGARAQTAAWLRTFQAASFGDCYRIGWVLDRVEPAEPLVDRDRLAASAVAALRCPSCAGAMAAAEPSLLACRGCGRLAPRDVNGAWDLAAPQLEGPPSDRPVVFWCQPSWEPAGLASLLHAFADRGDDAALVLRADPGAIAGEQALARATTALAGRAMPPDAEVVILNEPLTAEQERALRAAAIVVDERSPEPLTR